MKQQTTERGAVKEARSKFLAMASSYCLGVFNDNFFKQAAMLVAVSAGLSHLQGRATILFALPFILFSSYAGWLADHFPKKNVVVGAKAAEIVAMLIGAAGLITGNWALVLAMVFLMGMQSAFFNPALNGSIPELYPASYVPKANAILKLFTTLAILIGIATCGLTLDQQWGPSGGVPFGIILVSLVVVLMAVVGFAASLGVPKRIVAHSRNPFPWLGPIDSVRDFIDIGKDRQLLIAMVSDMFFYFVASIAILTINVLGLEQLGYSQTITSMLSMSLMLGVCIGSFVAAKRMLMTEWSRHLVISGMGMSVGFLLSALTPQLPLAIQIWWLAASLIITGIGGGVFLIPITSFLQVRPESSEKGRVLATANFCGFIGIMVSGSIFNILNGFLMASEIMTFLAIFAFIFTSILFFVKLQTVKQGQAAKPFISKLARLILSSRYSIEIKGMDSLDLDKNKGILFLPNHPALIDPVIVMSCLYSKFAPRPLSDTDQASKPFVKHVMKLIQPITLPDLYKNGRSGRQRVKEALNEVAHCLRNGEQVILYPAGRIYRSAKESLAGNSGVEAVLQNAPDVQVVLVRTKGLWGSSFGRASGSEPSLFKHIKKYLLALLSGGLFFCPRRKVTIELVHDTELAKLENRRGMNSYLESFYNAESEENIYVPYFWWQKSQRRTLAEPLQKTISGNIEAVPQSITEQVLAKIEEIAGEKVMGAERLANDLALDSLTIMELVAWLENEFGIPVEDSAALETVNDCILAASGQLATGGEVKLKKIPQSWFAGKESPLVFKKSESIAASFFSQAIKNPNKALLADQISGVKSYRDILISIFVLKPLIEKIEGPYVGIMLPATVSASIVYLATLFSGKIPVMFNWTGGVANMDHGISETGVNTIITASALYKRIEEQQNTDLSNLKTEWLYLEDVGATTSIFTKVRALLKSYCWKKSLARVEVPETAAILFTSGSESKPKAVPLSHDNIMTNMIDFSMMFQFTDKKTLIGMLPPFHSLGLVGTIILPLCIGLRTVYHANPTESATLVKLIDAYGVSMAIGTPTFMDGIFNSGTSEQLKSLDLVFTGAEKCPAHVYEGLSRINPEAKLCEGYGITECSPLVSINSLEQIKEGTIGKVMPSITYAIVDEKSGKRAKVGDKGMLLVRGPSIFSGYLNDSSGKGFCEFEERLWYTTGDYVVEDENQILSFCGRKKRFIKLAGEMISLPAIENVLLESFCETHANGPALAVEATSDDGHPEIVLFSTIPIVREEANMILKNAGLSALHNIRRLQSIKEIPLLGSGKTDYKILQQMIVA